jgi:hypothetical protein
MISKLYAAWLACVAIYGDASQFDNCLSIGPDNIGLKVVNNTWTASIQGTTDGAMWRSNFEIAPTPDPILGPVHTGFLLSSRAIYAAIKSDMQKAVAAGQDIVIDGHSRGASLADGVATHAALDGIKVAVAMFEAAPIGRQQYVDLCAMLQRNGMIDVMISTTNGIDPVPFSDDILGYEATYDRVNLDEKPDDVLNPIAWHMEWVIYKAMQRLYPNG